MRKDMPVFRISWFSRDGFAIEFANYSANYNKSKEELIVNFVNKEKLTVKVDIILETLYIDKDGLISFCVEGHVGGPSVSFHPELISVLNFRLDF